MDEQLEKVRRMIAAGRQEAALEALAEAALKTDEDIHAQVLGLSNKQQILNREKLSGVLDFNQVGQRQAQITQGILQIINQLRNYEPGSSAGKPAGETGKTGPGIILFLGANPMDGNRLDLETEIRDMEQKLKLGKSRDRYELKSAWAVTSRTLNESLFEYEPEIVHFSGHGLGESGLFLDDGKGRSKAVGSDALEMLFELHADKNVRCVVLNACYSEPQAQAISRKVDFVVGMSRAVKDLTAAEFSVGFYTALASGSDYEEAFAIRTDGHQIGRFAGCGNSDFIEKKS